MCSVCGVFGSLLPWPGSVSVRVLAHFCDGVLRRGDDNNACEDAAVVFSSAY